VSREDGQHRENAVGVARVVDGGEALGVGRWGRAQQAPEVLGEHGRGEQLLKVRGHAVERLARCQRAMESSGSGKGGRRCTLGPWMPLAAPPSIGCLS